MGDLVTVKGRVEIPVGDGRCLRVVNRGPGPVDVNGVALAQDQAQTVTESVVLEAADVRVWVGEVTTASHTHELTDVVGLSGELAGKADVDDPRLSDARSPLSHSHALSDVSGLVSGLAGKVETDDSRLSDARTPLAHAHAQSEVTGLVSALAGKAQVTHTHSTGDVTGLDAALAGKASSSHTHPVSDIQASGTPSSTTFLRGDGAWSPGGGGFAWTYAGRQANDLTHALASFANTELIFSYEANATYAIDLFLLCSSSAATIGYKFAFDVSTAVTAVALNYEHQLANSGTLSGGYSNADSAASGTSSGVPGAGALVPITGSGVLVTSGNAGTCRLVFQSETGASATFRAGSVLRVHRIA